MKIEILVSCATLGASYVPGAVHDVGNPIARDLVRASHARVHVMLNPALQDGGSRPPGYRAQLTEAVRLLQTRWLLEGRGYGGQPRG